MNYKKWIFLFLSFAFILAADNMIDLNIGKIEPPTCKNCEVPITGERCEACDSPIKLIGVFQYEGHQVRFDKFFESYEDYRTYIAQGKLYNIVGIPMAIVGGASLLCFFYCIYRDKHKRSQFV